MKQDNRPGWPPLALTPDEAAYELRMSKSELYKRMNSGEIYSVLLGPQIRRIPRSEIERYLEGKMAEQHPEHGAA